MYRAKISFVGKVVGVKGHNIEINDKNIVTDLLKAGYIEEIKDKPTTKPNKKAKSEEENTSE